MTYDTQGRVATQQDALGQQTTFTYGTNTSTVTLPVTSNDPSWAPTITDTYDGQGRITQRLVKPSSSETTTHIFGYDCNGNRRQVTDANGNSSNFCYDGARNLTRAVGPAATDARTGTSYRPVTFYTYDAANNLLRAVPPEGMGAASADCTVDVSGTAAGSSFRTDIIYDNAAKPHVVTVSRYFTNPDGGGLQTTTTTYTYDVSAPGSGAPGRVLSVQTPRSNATTF